MRDVADWLETEKAAVRTGMALGAGIHFKTFGICAGEIVTHRTQRGAAEARCPRILLEEPKELDALVLQLLYHGHLNLLIHDFINLETLYEMGECR